MTTIFLVVFLIFANFVYNKWHLLEKSYSNVESSYTVLNEIKQLQTDYLQLTGMQESFIESKDTLYLSKRRANEAHLRESLENITNKLDDAKAVVILNDIQFNILKLKDLFTSAEFDLTSQNDQEKYRALLSERTEEFNTFIKKLVQNQKNHLRLKIEKNEKIYETIVTSLIAAGAGLLVLLILLIYFFAKLSQKKQLIDAALEDTEGRFVLAIEATNDGIYDWNLKTDEVYYSEKYWSLLGYSQKDNFKNSIQDFKDHLFEEDKEYVFQAVEDYLEGRRSEFDVSFRMKHKDGKTVWIQSKGKALFNDQGKPYRLVGSHSDISLQKAVEKQLLRSKEHAEDANRAKSHFLAHMSHEIRTPLTSIIGIGELLARRLKKDSDEKVVKLLDTLNKSATTLQDLINNILDFSKIEAGEVTLDYETVSLKDIVEPIMSILGVKASEKGLTLKTQATIDLADQYKIEPLRLKQILLNLLSNAIKFTDEGEVTLTIEIKEIENIEFLSFAVKDTGAGIPKGQLEVIFDSFKQLDSNDNRKNMGTGLGLSISSKLASLMKGYINVESKVGEGSVFELFVPAHSDETNMVVKKQADQALKTLKSDLSSSPQIKILVCEDYDGNIIYLETLLEELGYDFVIAKNGKEGLDIWREKAFDVVLMDVQMPVMDGFQATQAIRDEEKNNKIPENLQCHIVGMTAHALIADEDKCINVGMNDYISKPIDEKKLIKILKMIERKRA